MSWSITYIEDQAYNQWYLLIVKINDKIQNLLNK